MTIKSQKMFDGSILKVEIHRPQAKNALNSKCMKELTDLFYEMQNQKSCRVIVITGADHHFAAGADIHEMVNCKEMDAKKLAENVFRLNEVMSQVPQIIISNIEGYCLGGGLELALSTDIRVAHPNATFGLPEVKLGILPGGGGTQKLRETVGVAIASKLILSGEYFTAQEALSYGLISEVHEQSFERAMELAQKISLYSGFTLSSIKQLISGISFKQKQNEFEEEIHTFAQLFSKGEAIEGLRAFQEKRKPNFNMR